MSQAYNFAMPNRYW